MQIVLLLLIATTAFAQKGGKPPVQCDPKVAEKECYAKLCSPSTSRLIPSDREELIKAYSAHKYEIHPQIQTNMDKVESISRNMQSSFKDALSNPDIISDEIVKSPVSLFAPVATLLEEDMKCLGSNGTCEMVSSDLGSYSDEAKAFFKEWYESTFIFRDGILLPVKEQKKQMTVILQKMSGVLSEDEIKTEKKKISKLKYPIDLSNYLYQASWIKKYEEKISRDLVSKKKVLNEILSIKLKEVSEVNVARLSNRTLKSCQLADYLETTLNNNVTQEKFEKARAEAIQGLKNNFLAKLSEESFKKLSASLDPSKIHLFEPMGSYRPFTPNFSVHANEYKAPFKGTDYLRDIGLFQNFASHVCDSKLSLPIDVFNFGTEEMFLSKFTIANGYGNVIAHELGHWVSKQLVTNKMSSHSRRKLDKVRKCVRGYYPKEKTPSPMLFKDKKDHVYVEEDFADWVASVAGPKVPGFYCEMDKLLENIGGITSPSSYLPRSGDTHSNQLFREISTMMNRGEKLPQSCVDLVGVYPEMQPKKCEW